MKSKAYTAIKIVLIVLLVLSTTSGFYKFVIMKDFDAFFYVPCNTDDNIACFTNEEECLPENYDSCAYSVILVPEKGLDCENDNGECLQEFCESEPALCSYLTKQSDYERYGIYGQLLE